MTGFKKVIYPLLIAAALFALAVTTVISWQAFYWGAGIMVAAAILLAIVETMKSRRYRS